MNRIRIGLAYFATFIGGAAFLLVLLGYLFHRALESLSRVLSLGNLSGEVQIISTPLGYGILFVYVAGISLGLTALRRPVAAGIAMLPLGACAFLFGGPIAKYYGIGIVCNGGLLLAAALWHRKAKT